MEAVPESGELAAPGPRRAADPMQEHQRCQGRIAGGLIAEATVAGLALRGRAGRDGWQAYSPWRIGNASILTGPARKKSDILGLKHRRAASSTAAGSHPIESLAIAAAAAVRIRDR